MSAPIYCFACTWGGTDAPEAYVGGLADMLCYGVVGARAYLCDTHEKAFTEHVRTRGGIPGRDRGLSPNAPPCPAEIYCPRCGRVNREGGS